MSTDEHTTQVDHCGHKYLDGNLIIIITISMQINDVKVSLPEAVIE